MEFHIPESFFKEEELCGHLVTTQMKLLWAKQLGCLNELKRICKKHNLLYFASGGTLLGAVRHKGYIPWDDDIDVFMFYDDYVKLCEIAPQELSYPFYFQHYKTERNSGAALSRIRNSETTGCTKMDWILADGNYNCGIFIDIFPIFGIEDRKIPFMIQKTRMKIWWYALSGFDTKQLLKKSGWKFKYNFTPKILWWNVLSLFTNHAWVSERYIKACACAKSYKKMGLLSFAGFSEKMVWNKEWFNEMITLPFEFTDIVCPKDYDPVLRTQYGDYMKFVKGKQIHSLVLCDPDTPYKVKMKNLEKSSLH